MNVMIPINYDGEQPTVSARELHENWYMNRRKRTVNRKSVNCLQGQTLKICKASYTKKNISRLWLIRLNQSCMTCMKDSLQQ